MTPQQAAEQMTQAAQRLCDVDRLLADLGERLAQAAQEVAADARLIDTPPVAPHACGEERGDRRG